MGVTHHQAELAESLTIAPTLLKCNCGARTHDGCVNLEEYLLPRKTLNRRLVLYLREREGAGGEMS